MAIILPTGYSTFADSTSTPGGALSKYVLAQFRSDSDVAWVHDLRVLLAVDELKWKVFEPRRQRIQANVDLWNRIEAGMANATIIIIDPQPVELALKLAFEREGAEEGHDFTQSDLVDACATALVRGTPVAYLPSEISLRLGIYDPEPFLSFERFTPEAIRSRIGGGLRDAKIFAARAHAMFDVQPLVDSVVDPREVPRSPLSSVVLIELLSVTRGFDEEDPKSLAVLNEASDVIADAMQDVVMTPGKYSNKPLVQEYSSKGIDHLQAADLAAGWARELLALGNERALLQRFQRVLLNGKLME